MPRPLALIACSKLKHRHITRAPAREVYVGTLVRMGLRWAEENDHQPIILSAKYGFISADEMITTYDQKIREPAPTIAYPRGSGVYIGSLLYFAHAPARFRPLVTPSTLGLMQRDLRKLLRDKRSAGVRNSRPQKTGGVTWWLAHWLQNNKYTKKQLLAMLKRKFPHGNPRMFVTVDVQLRQQRIGDERNCILRSDDKGYFWLEAK